MLIGNSSKRPSLKAVRRIKRVLSEVLDLPEDALITVTQLACLEEDCAPLETAIGLLRPGAPSFNRKSTRSRGCGRHRSRSCVRGLGVSVEVSALESIFKES